MTAYFPSCRLAPGTMRSAAAASLAPERVIISTFRTFRSCGASRRSWKSIGGMTRIGSNVSGTTSSWRSSGSPPRTMSWTTNSSMSSNSPAITTSASTSAPPPTRTFGRTSRTKPSLVITSV